MADTLVDFLRLDDEEQVVEYVASRKVLGRDGKPAVWKIRALTAKENDVLMKKCMREVPVHGKRGNTTTEMDYSKYARELSAACTVVPDLQDANLQNHYGVTEPTDLFCKLLPLLAEQNAYAEKVRKVNRFDEDFEDLVDEAKN